LTLTSDEQGAFGTAGLTQPGTLTLTYTGGQVELLKDI
jgi:hypothetical protein